MRVSFFVFMIWAGNVTAQSFQEGQYTDTIDGYTFVIPEGWKHFSPNEIHQFVNSKFRHWDILLNQVPDSLYHDKYSQDSLKAFGDSLFFITAYHYLDSNTLYTEFANAEYVDTMTHIWIFRFFSPTEVFCASANSWQLPEPLEEMKVLLLEILDSIVLFEPRKKYLKW